MSKQFVAKNSQRNREKNNETNKIQSENVSKYTPMDHPCFKSEFSHSKLKARKHWEEFKPKAKSGLQIISENS